MTHTKIQDVILLEKVKSLNVPLKKVPLFIKLHSNLCMVQKQWKPQSLITNLVVTPRDLKQWHLSYKEYRDSTIRKRPTHLHHWMELDTRKILMKGNKIWKERNMQNLIVKFYIEANLSNSLFVSMEPSIPTLWLLEQPKISKTRWFHLKSQPCSVLLRRVIQPM